MTDKVREDEVLRNDKTSPTAEDTFVKIEMCSTSLSSCAETTEKYSVCSDQTANKNDPSQSQFQNSAYDKDGGRSELRNTTTTGAACDIITRKRNLYLTRRRVQDFQPFKCSFCDSSFVHHTHLRIHERTHTGEKPHQCRFCIRSFAQKGNLKVHEKIHTGEKDFGCEYCTKAFITNAQLLVHMRTHTNPNKKRPHITGRPSKNGTLKRLKNENNATENDSELTSDGVTESMKQILDQLAATSDKKSAVTFPPCQQQTHSNAKPLFTVVTPKSPSLNSLVGVSTTHQENQNLIITSSSPQESCRDFRLQVTTTAFQNVSSSIQHIAVDSFSDEDQAALVQGSRMQNSLYTQ